jgi:hypothetical protein
LDRVGESAPRQIESRLPANLSTLETASSSLEAQLTAELWRAGMFQPEKPGSAVGYISSLSVQRPAEYPNVVIVQSGISVPCGSDVFSTFIGSRQTAGRGRLIRTGVGSMATVFWMRNSPLLILREIACCICRGTARVHVERPRIPRSSRQPRRRPRRGGSFRHSQLCHR